MTKIIPQMKIIMVAAISEDGFLTKAEDSDVSKWTSTEDKMFFSKIKSEHNIYIMGSKTYESASIKPEPGILRIIMTRSPEKYDDLKVDGQLEFTNLTPEKIIAKHQSQYESCLLLGGGQIYEEFLKQKLVNEIYLTVEPVVHGSGTSLMVNGEPVSSFLDHFEPTIAVLNNSGTKLLHYEL